MARALEWFALPPLLFLAACSGSADQASMDVSSPDGASPAPVERDAGAPHADGALPPLLDAATSDAAHGGSDAAPPAADAGGLNPHAAPGANFDLSLWELQEPVGSPGAPTTISSAQLRAGYQDAYFFTDATDGAMTFWDPENGVTTANSSYPRSELRELTASGAAADWAVTGTHTLRATLRVTEVPDHVCVGQIHLGTGTPASTKPLLELFYLASGAIQLGLEQSPAGGNEIRYPVGNAPLGTKWSYEITLSGNAIGISIDGGAAQPFAMSSTFDKENMYFKAGDYDQSVGTSATVGAKVAFYALSVAHTP